MEYPGGGGGAVLSGGNVPAFLTKLWTLVEDPDTDPLICWSPNGTSFHVFDQGRFSKEVLPKFFKHNNMASFIRQLNMYGFRKVVHIEQGGLVKPERDDTEFQHPFFIRGQEHLLENIKRKVTNVSSVRQEEVKISADEVHKILNDVQMMKGKQETIDSRIIAMKHENEALWREMASLRQRHAQQQKVVNKLLSEDPPKGGDESSNNTGKQLVQYTPVLTEPINMEPGGADLPSLLELEAERFFNSDPPTDDLGSDLLSHIHTESGL